MKQIADLMPLASLEDLREFCQDYARKDKKFNKELTAFLNSRFIDDEDSAADFIARLEDAFSEEKNIGDRWHSYYVTDWDEVYSTATDVLKDARRKIALLEKMGCKEESAKAIGQYLYMPEVRKHEIEKAMGQKDFQKAITLIKGGEKIAEEKDRMRQSMEAMLKLSNGKTAAHQLAEHFRDVYRRRPSFMAEISKF